MYYRERNDYWDFKNVNTKEYTHCYHTYPAMMIPQVARELLKQYAPIGRMELVFDPYVGSGTTLVESSIAGINSIGTDLNPLARFISTVKTTHYDEQEVANGLFYIENHFSIYTPSLVRNTDFGRITNYDFWYDKSVLLKLSYIDQLISDLPDSVRSFFYIALSEVVRETSYTRNGEFKRFRMTEKSIEKFNPDVFKLFTDKVQRNILGLEQYNRIKNSNTTNVCDFNTVSNIADNIIEAGSVDMIITSPPYGDSHTTVAYGQFSRWANEWFSFPNAKNLDTILMGGQKKRKINIEPISIADELKSIKEIDEIRYNEVSSFLQDYYNSIKNIAPLVRDGGRVCYVVGNRTVKGVQIPLDLFTAEVFESMKFKHDITIVREIPSKRMPSKNSPTNEIGKVAETMTNEYIVILTKNI